MTTISLPAPDGPTTDSGPRLRQAIAALGAGGGTIDLAPALFRIVVTAKDLCVGIPSGVTLRGVPDHTVLSFESDDPTGLQYREGLRLHGSWITLENLTIERKGPFTGVLVKLWTVWMLRLAGVVIDGMISNFGGSVHGIEVAPVSGGVSAGVQLDRCEIMDCQTGFFMTPESRALLLDFEAARCRFSINYADLDLDAPSGTMRGIRVTDCEFTSGTCPSASAGGFGVGLANVQDAHFTGCRFKDYRASPFHIEANSSNVRIRDCSFENCGNEAYGIINVIKSSHNILIDGCTIDATSLTKPVPAVLVGTGGDFPCAGDVSVDRCAISLGAVACGPEFYGTRGCALRDSRITGAGPASTGWAWSIRNATGALVRGNQLRGLPAPERTDPAMPPHGCCVEGNVIEACAATDKEGNV